MTITIDVETIPMEASLLLPYPESERPHPGNYSKPDAIAGWRTKDMAAWESERVKVASVNPRLGRIVCLGFAENDEDAKTITVVGESAETTALYAFWDMVVDHDRVVTWNGAFDLRFICIRSLAHGIAVPNRVQVASWFKRFSLTTHFDCKMALCEWDRFSKEGLNEWAAFFGIPAKPSGISGADVYPMHLLGHHDEIADYCRGDVSTTREIYRRISPMFV